MAKFKTGDVVCLRSGGPVMTVDFTMGVEQPLVSVHWFNKSVLVRDCLHEDCIEPAVLIEGEEDQQRTYAS